MEPIRKPRVAISKFDTNVQLLKYKVLKEVARLAWEDNLSAKVLDIPKTIVPGKKPSLRCCVYKERAILSERVKLAMGGDENTHVIEVLDIACDECPVGGYEVSNTCRGCLAHRCESVCRRNAITFDRNHVAVIDKSLCVECGACAKVCPFNAIVNRKRPCENACKVKAISMSGEKEAWIDQEKCVSCGACAYQCPFGAISDKSYILDVIRFIKESEKNEKYPVYAIVAPAVSSQFTYAKLGQVVSGLKRLGFYKVVEAALGADIVAKHEAKELAEKGFLISSCCPAFKAYVKKEFPDLYGFVSENLSPMATMAKCIKEKTPTAKVVFVGPCTAKKNESKLPEVAPYVDAVITFEELQALYDSKGVEITMLDESPLDDASVFGRVFGRTGGLSEAVKQSLAEQELGFEVVPVACDGIEECKIALLKKRRNMLEGNFIEGMACVGGCIGGAGCLTHGEKNRFAVDRYGKDAKQKSILSSVESAEDKI